MSIARVKRSAMLALLVTCSSGMFVGRTACDGVWDKVKSKTQTGLFLAYQAVTSYPQVVLATLIILAQKNKKELPKRLKDRFVTLANNKPYLTFFGGSLLLKGLLK